MLDAASVQPKPGLFGSLRALVTTLVTIASTRLEILATEYEQEKLRLGRMLMLWTALAFFAAMALVFLSLLLVMLFWDSHRMAAIGAITVADAVLALAAAGWLRHEVRRGSHLFSVSLAELRKDRQALEAR